MGGFDTYNRDLMQVVLTCSLKSCSFAGHCHKFPPDSDSKFPRISGPETVSSVTTTSIKAARESRIFKNDRFVLLPASADACPRVVVQSVHQAGTPEERHTLVSNS